MEKFTEILNQCTGFLEGLRGNDQFVQLFGSVVRYLLPVLVTFGVYKGLGSKKMTTVRMVWLIIVICIVLSFFGIL